MRSASKSTITAKGVKKNRSGAKLSSLPATEPSCGRMINIGSAQIKLRTLKDLRLGGTWAMADHSSSLQMTEMNLFTPDRERERQRGRSSEGERKSLSTPHNAELKLMHPSRCFD